MSRDRAPRRPAAGGAAPITIDGRRRVVIEDITPSVDAGRFPIKRIVGDRVIVEVDAFTDGHDELQIRLVHTDPAGTVRESPMVALGNDRWRGELTVATMGRHRYTIAGWIDRFGTWRHDLEKRIAAGQDVAVDLEIGARIIDEAAASANGHDRERLAALAASLRTGPAARRARTAVSDGLASVMARHPDRSLETTAEPAREIVVDPVHAEFSAWYELFPRSTAPEPDRHGTLRDVIGRLPYVADLGFDVLYLPPIHPIGTTFRKGPNNVTTSGADDPGVPWAIGGVAGGHDAIHPDLGDVDDLRALIEAAATRGIRVAIDLAFQASPDHPYVRDHPDWFRARPDGTIQYAENPPKKYQDIYPFDFEAADWQGLWQDLRRVVRGWMDVGVRIFRVDNPHTKPFAFWEWLIGDIKATDPDVLFLSEAFTRPKVMYRLAKLGFSQSYTYFTWRNTKAELTEYLTQLREAPVRDFFRPNFWTNTPDILHATLQDGGRPAFISRLVLAATLTPSFGIYGPAFELLERTPREPGSEEYLHSEKYQLRHWDLDAPHSIGPIVAAVNRARRSHPALQRADGLAFLPIDNDALIAYARHSPAADDLVIVIVSLDPDNVRQGWLDLPLDALGLPADEAFEAEDLLGAGTFAWQGPRAFIELDPAGTPAHVLHVRRRPPGARRSARPTRARVAAAPRAATRPRAGAAR